MNEMDAYPLCWPSGWPKTERYRRRKSVFGDASFALVRDELMRELKRFNATNIILSTNIPLRKDGLPYSGYRQPDDVGVAVYFKIKGKPMVFACDKWTKIEDNIKAVFKTIDALRGVERWGSSDLLERAFQGFTALPAPRPKRHWHEVLEVNQHDSPLVVQSQWRNLMMLHHPDRGGNPEIAKEINEAYQQAKREGRAI